MRFFKSMADYGGFLITLWFMFWITNGVPTLDGLLGGGILLFLIGAIGAVITYSITRKE
jgi:hypothetical protein